MIEGESDFVGEEDMMRAIEVGHAAVRDLCLGESVLSHPTFLGGWASRSTCRLGSAPPTVVECEVFLDSFEVQRRNCKKSVAWMS